MLLARPARVSAALMLRACASIAGFCTRGNTAALTGATPGLNLRARGTGVGNW
jgi:hypothetical protein